jgi:hypothetical protein
VQEVMTTNTRADGTPNWNTASDRSAGLPGLSSDVEIDEGNPKVAFVVGTVRGFDSRATPAGLTAVEAARRGRPERKADTPEHPLRRTLRHFWSPVPWMLEATIPLQLAADARPARTKGQAQLSIASRRPRIAGARLDKVLSVMSGFSARTASRNSRCGSILTRL